MRIDDQTKLAAVKALMSHAERFWGWGWNAEYQDVAIAVDVVVGAIERIHDEQQAKADLPSLPF